MNYIIVYLITTACISVFSKTIFLMAGEYPRTVQIKRWMDVGDLIIGVIVLTCFFMIKGGE